MPGKFELYHDKSGGFRFRLKASNGQIILSSQSYKNKSGCLKGIESVRANSAVEERFSKSETKAGKYAFNLLAANKQVIGTSQQYKTTASRDKGIKSVMTNGKDANLVELIT
ncbi:MAG: YegP family protein [Thermodesulfobacteriota bacterium]